MSHFLCCLCVFKNNLSCELECEVHPIYLKVWYKNRITEDVNPFGFFFDLPIKSTTNTGHIMTSPTPAPTRTELHRNYKSPLRLSMQEFDMVYEENVDSFKKWLRRKNWPRWIMESRDSFHLWALELKSLLPLCWFSKCGCVGGGKGEVKSGEGQLGGAAGIPFK